MEVAGFPNMRWREVRAWGQPGPHVRRRRHGGGRTVGEEWGQGLTLHISLQAVGSHSRLLSEGGSAAPARQGPSSPGTLETRFPATVLLTFFVGFGHHGHVLPAWPLDLCPKGVRLDSAATPGPPGRETQRKVGSLRAVTSPLLLARCLQRPAGMEGAECSCHWHMCLHSFHIHSPILQIRATEAQGVK